MLFNLNNFARFYSFGIEATNNIINNLKQLVEAVDWGVGLYCPDDSIAIGEVFTRQPEQQNKHTLLNKENLSILFQNLQPTCLLLSYPRMGNTTYSPQLYTNAPNLAEDYFLQGWTPQQRVWKHKFLDEEIEEYPLITVNDQQEARRERQIFQFRSQVPSLVKGVYFVDLSSRNLCNAQRQIQLFTEHIHLRLSDIRDIPYPDILHLTLRCLQGFGILYEKCGEFLIEESLICFNKDSEAKVWVNSNLSKSHPEASARIKICSINLDSQRIQQSHEQKHMIKQLLDLLQLNTNGPQGLQSFAEFCRDTFPYTFREAIILFWKYTKIIKMEVPSTMECLKPLIIKTAEAFPNIRLQGKQSYQLKQHQSSNFLVTQQLLESVNVDTNKQNSMQLQNTTRLSSPQVKYYQSTNNPALSGQYNSPDNRSQIPGSVNMLNSFYQNPIHMSRNNAPPENHLAQQIPKNKGKNTFLLAGQVYANRVTHLNASSSRNKQNRVHRSVSREQIVHFQNPGSKKDILVQTGQSLTSSVGQLEVVSPSLQSRFSPTNPSPHSIIETPQFSRYVIVPPSEGHHNSNTQRTNIHMPQSASLSSLRFQPDLITTVKYFQSQKFHREQGSNNIQFSYRSPQNRLGSMQKQQIKNIREGPIQPLTFRHQQRVIYVNRSPSTQIQSWESSPIQQGIQFRNQYSYTNARADLQKSPTHLYFSNKFSSPTQASSVTKHTSNKNMMNTHLSRSDSADSQSRRRTVTNRIHKQIATAEVHKITRTRTLTASSGKKQDYSIQSEDSVYIASGLHLEDD